MKNIVIYGEDSSFSSIDITQITLALLDNFSKADCPEDIHIYCQGSAIVQEASRKFAEEHGFAFSSTYTNNKYGKATEEICDRDLFEGLKGSSKSGDNIFLHIGDPKSARSKRHVALAIKYRFQIYASKMRLGEFSQSNIRKLA
ncbi:hypothetical protein M2146_001161 [Lachnospiraceae bacterium PF1-22]